MPKAAVDNDPTCAEVSPNICVAVSPCHCTVVRVSSLFVANEAMPLIEIALICVLDRRRTSAVVQMAKSVADNLDN